MGRAGPMQSGQECCGYRPIRARDLIRLQRRQYRLNSAYVQSGLGMLQWSGIYAS